MYNTRFYKRSTNSLSPPLVGHTHSYNNWHSQRSERPPTLVTHNATSDGQKNSTAKCSLKKPNKHPQDAQ